MAPSVKAQGGHVAASTTPAKTPASNGVITEPPAPAVNRKKAKRRAKDKARREAAASQRAAEDDASDELDDTDLAPPGGYPNPTTPRPPPELQYDPRYPNHLDQYDDPDETGYAYSDEENPHQDYHQEYASANGGNQHADGSTLGKRNKKKKKKEQDSQYESYPEEQAPVEYYHPPPPRPRAPPTITEDALRTVEQKVNDDVWETAQIGERHKIRQFWLQLPEKERRELVKIEKDAVLKKMKEQQKHSCSCTVCGRKRTAIEEELELLYNAYYTELEQYASSGQRPPQSFSPLNVGTIPQRPSFSHTTLPSHGRIQEYPDDEEDDLDDLEDEYDEGDGYGPEDYGGENQVMRQGYDTFDSRRNDFFTFGQNLTVKNGLLTVGDELLNNHGEKFIDMMEQLATARMRRESEAYEAYRFTHNHHDPHGHHYSEEDDYDDEEEYDDDESQLDEYEEDDEMDAMTEAQRMQEGRRMFQIFAARMFEQRVLGAYRDNVSKMKAAQLIAEEEAEKQGGAQREAKKAREAEKKKAKKQQKKAAEAEKKLKKDAERAEAERAAKEAEEKRQEEARLKREEQKRKREEEKKAADEQRRRKDEEKRRAQEEAKAKQQEKERQAREQKAAEKLRKEEERKRQQEEKEAKAAALRERKAQEDKERQQIEERARKEAESADRRRREEDAAKKAASQNESSRRAPPPSVALPPTLSQQRSQTGSQPSPQPKSTTPAIPKTTTPQQRQPSGPASLASSSQEHETSHSSKQSTPPTQPGPTTSHPTSAGSTRAPSRQPQVPYPPMTSPHPVGPPPGMPFPPQTNFPGIPPHGMNNFPPGAGMPGMHPGFAAGRGGFQMGPQMNVPFRPGPPQGPHFPPGMPQGAPGMHFRGYGQELPPTHTPYDAPKIFSAPGSRPAQPTTQPIGSHSRQPSSSFEASPSENAQAPQPIGRPHPIQRPDSTKPEQMNAKNRAQSMPQGNKQPDADGYLGSSALLGDSEPSNEAIERRQTAPHLAASATTPGLSQHTPFGHDPPQPFGARPSPGFASPIAGNAAGWTSGWAGPTGFGANVPQRHGISRLSLVRKLAAEVLSHSPPHAHLEHAQEVGQLLNLVNSTKPKQEQLVQMNELQSILDTEGDSSNGGGVFNLSQSNKMVIVSWVPSDLGTRGAPARSNVIGGGTGAPTTGGLGEIGSPLPGALRMADPRTF